MKTKQQQLRTMISKQKKLCNRATNDYDRFCLFGIWIGILNGMKMTNAITRQEYQDLYDEMEQYNQKLKKTG